MKTSYLITRAPFYYSQLFISKSKQLKVDSRQHITLPSYASLSAVYNVTSATQCNFHY